jgi:ribosome modulation factor
MNLSIGWLGCNRQALQETLTGNRALGCILVVESVDESDRLSNACQVFRDDGIDGSNRTVGPYSHREKS